jgi:hypothetical protein
MKIKNIKEEVPKIWKTSEKKESNRNTKHSEGHSSRLEQVEDRISEFKDEIEIKEKKLKKCWYNYTEQTNNI